MMHHIFEGGWAVGSAAAVIHVGSADQGHITRWWPDALYGV